MMVYIARTIAGGVLGYIFGFGAGVILIVRTLSDGNSQMRAGSSIVDFLMVLAIESAIVGMIAGLVIGRSCGYKIIARSVITGAIAGWLLVYLAVIMTGRHVGPNGEYLIAAQPVHNVASVNMLWGALVGLVAGFIIGFFSRESKTACDGTDAEVVEDAAAAPAAE